MRGIQNHQASVRLHTENRIAEWNGRIYVIEKSIQLIVVSHIEKSRKVADAREIRLKCPGKLIERGEIFCAEGHTCNHKKDVQKDRHKRTADYNIKRRFIDAAYAIDDKCQRCHANEGESVAVVHEKQRNTDYHKIQQGFNQL